MADCNLPVQLPCGPGPYDSPVCYSVPPSLTVLNGFKRVTLNPDCSAATVQILDDTLTPVPGAVEAGCDPLAPQSCCDPLSLCAILQGLPTQVPGVTDTALFVDAIGGCFLGVPGGGGGGFPGYGSPVATACANADGVSLLVARADHVHRSTTPVQDDGVLTSTRCTLNFTGAGVVVTDDAGGDRSNIAIAGTVFPLLAPDGSCAAPSYSFSSSPDSGMFYTGSAVRISDDACTDFIEVGASINIFTTATDVAVMSGAQFTGAAATAISLTAGTSLTAAATSTMTLSAGGAVNATAGTTFNIVSTGGNTTIDAGTNFLLTTGATLRLTVQSSGAWSIGGSVGAAGNVLTSNGAGTPPTWTANVSFPGFGAPPANTVDAAAPTAGVAATAMRSDAKLQAATGTPVATAQANADGVATTLSRSDHVHRTIIEVEDAGVLVGSRPTINFIDGTNVTITAVDNGGSDRVDITIAAASGGGSFIQRFTFQADQFDSPVNSNWAVNALAPAAADSTNPALTVRRFDDTTQEGVGGLLTVPTGAVNATFYFKWRAQTAPGVAAGVVLTYYTRSIPDNAAVGAWSAAVDFTTLAVPTNANFQYDSQTISLATLGWTVATLRQFEITRRGTQAGDTLAGDFDLAELIIEFTT